MRKLKAITLIETLIYMALLTVFVATVMQFALSTAEYNRTAESRVLLQQTIIYLDTHLRESFLTNNAVLDGSSVYNSDNGELVLQKAGSNVNYTLEDNKLYYTSLSEKTQISPTEIQVTKFNIVPIQYTPNQTVGVRVTISLNDPKNSQNNNEFATSYIF